MGTAETGRKRRFRLFDPMRDGRGADPLEDKTPNLKYFFKLWGRQFWRLISLNLLMLPQILPPLLCVYLSITGPKIPTQYAPTYAALLGAQTARPTSEGLTLLTGAMGLLREYRTFRTPVLWIMGALLLFQLATFGWQKCASTYILRNLARGDGVFLLSDYFHAIRRNLKQGLLMGLIDCLAIGVLAFDFVSLLSLPPSGLVNFMYAATIALALLYAVMRFYTYLMLVTFDMKLRKIFKNALIFTALGIKRNLMACLGVAALAAVTGSVVVLGMQARLYAALILPFLFFLSFSAFMCVYAAYPVIQKYMIDPLPPRVPADEGEAGDGAPEEGEPPAAPERPA